MEYGHLAHIELLFFYDRTVPGRRNVTAAISQKSLETDIKHGYHAATPMQGKALEKLGPLWSNYHVWLNKIKESFDPLDLSNPAH